MKVWTGDPRHWGPGPVRGTALTIGVFDGVHRGHRKILENLSALAHRCGDLRTAVITFDVHPRSVVDPRRSPKMLTTIARRIEILDSMGVDEVGVLPFASIKHLPPHQFVRRVLVDGFNVRAVTVGRGFRYGAGRTGDIDSLIEAGERHGFTVEPQPLLSGGEGPISSSTIRGSIAEGDVETAADLLGRYHELEGSVRRFESKEGLSAVLEIDRAMAVPGPGVYTVQAVIDGRSLTGLCDTRSGAGDVSVRIHFTNILEVSQEKMTVRFVEPAPASAWETVGRPR